MGGFSEKVIFFSTPPGEEEAGRNARDRHPAGFGAAGAVEYVDVVGRRRDLAETGQRRADYVHPPDHFVRAAVGVDAVDQQGQDLKGLRAAAAYVGKAAGDIVEDQAERLFWRFNSSIASRGAWGRARAGGLTMVLPCAPPRGSPTRGGRGVGGRKF